MTMAEAATYLRILTPDGHPDARNARRWIDRHAIATKYRGREILVHVDDLDGALTPRTDGQRRKLRRAS
jgi:hypothetical protein